jgi:hypothetical protein
VTPRDLQKLLGGYAAGTLTPEERRALFDAALSDQTLFDALADEEPLREVLADPACRERVQAALVEPPRSAFWMRRPAVWTLAAATAAAAVVLTVFVLRDNPGPRTASAPRQIAMASKPVSPEIAPSTPAPEPAGASKPQAADRRTRSARVIEFHAPAPVAAGKSEPRMTELPPPPAFTAPRRELSAANEPSPTAGVGVGGKLDSAGSTVADAMAPAAPVARAAQVARSKPTAPPPPPPQSSTQNVTVVAEAVKPQSERIESKQMSRMAVAGRDAAELMKDMPGMAGLRYTLLRRGDGDRDVEVPPDTLFAARESARLRIEAAQSGYLYVLAGKRALFAGPVVANQPVVIVTRPGVLNAVLLPQPDSGPLSTLVSRARQQLEAVRFQRSDASRLGQPAPILTEISIKSR